MVKTKEKIEMFCSECGSQLIRVPVPAEKAKYTVCGWGDCYTTTLGSRFNRYTGMRQFGIRVMCPNTKWYNSCTSYIDEKSLHDSDLPELLKL